MREGARLALGMTIFRWYTAIVAGVFCILAVVAACDISGVIDLGSF